MNTSPFNLPFSLCATWSATLCASHPVAVRLLAQPNHDSHPSQHTEGAPSADLRVTLTALSANRALVSADLLLPTGSITLFPQRALPISLHITLQSVHIDVPHPTRQRNLLTLSFNHSAHIERAARPMYARTSLLAESGLIPAAFDPPTLLLQTSASTLPAASLAHATS